jgi:hypothetical protein
MDANAHYTSTYILTSVVREILRILPFNFCYHCTSLQLKKHMVLNNSQPVVLTVNF